MAKHQSPSLNLSSPATFNTFHQPTEILSAACSHQRGQNGATAISKIHSPKTSIIWTMWWFLRIHLQGWLSLTFKLTSEVSESSFEQVVIKNNFTGKCFNFTAAVLDMELKDLMFPMLDFRLVLVPFLPIWLFLPFGIGMFILCHYILEVLDFILIFTGAYG